MALGQTIDVNCDLYADSLDPLLQFYWTLNKRPLPSTMYSVESLTGDQSTDQTRWRPLKLNDSSALTTNVHSPNGQSVQETLNIVRSKLKFNSSNYLFEQASLASTLACWATNSIGQQIEPCLFSLLAIGKYFLSLYYVL